MPREYRPLIEKCPADRNKLTPEWASFEQRRTYSMLSVGGVFGREYMVNTSRQSYPLPAARLGVGVYWLDDGIPGTGKPDWNAKSYRTSVVKDPAGTILLGEQASWQNVAGNIWPCIMNGPIPQNTDSSSTDLYQMNPAGSASDHNYGKDLYKIQGQRFNYLLHDGHVPSLRIEQTLGAGATNAVKGMWTVAAGD